MFLFYSHPGKRRNKCPSSATYASGGSCAGKPGSRPRYGDNYYAAYVRDPDGNKLQAVRYTADD